MKPARDRQEAPLQPGQPTQLELQVVCAAGATNHEGAAQLLVSPPMVGHHLRACSSNWLSGLPPSWSTGRYRRRRRCRGPVYGPRGVLDRYPDRTGATAETVQRATDQTALLARPELWESGISGQLLRPEDGARSQNLNSKLAPEEGLEPTTLRLTALPAPSPTVPARPSRCPLAIQIAHPPSRMVPGRPFLPPRSRYQSGISRIAWRRRTVQSACNRIITPFR
jgi:hypothetical protein